MRTEPPVSPGLQRFGKVGFMPRCAMKRYRPELLSGRCRWSSRMVSRSGRWAAVGPGAQLQAIHVNDVDQIRSY